MGGRARLGARSLARVAARGDVDLDLAAAAGEGVLEPDLHVVAQVGAARGAALLLPPPERRAEDRFENIADIAEIGIAAAAEAVRSEEHTSELQSLMRISYAVFCLKKKKIKYRKQKNKT